LLGHFWAEFIFIHKLYKPHPKDAVCQISEYLECWFMRRRFLKMESPFPKDASYQIWLKLVQWFWRRSHLKKKLTEGQTDDRQWLIPIAHFEPSAQVSLKPQKPEWIINIFIQYLYKL